MSDVVQKRVLVTPVPGPRSAELHARKQAAVSGGIGTTLPVYVERAGGGILVDVDLVAAAVDGVGGAVGPLARRPVPTVALGADAPEAARAIVAGGMGAALVTDDGIVVGILTATDVLAGLAARGRPAGPGATQDPDARDLREDVRP